MCSFLVILGSMIEFETLFQKAANDDFRSLVEWMTEAPLQKHSLLEGSRCPLHEKNISKRIKKSAKEDSQTNYNKIIIRLLSNRLKHFRQSWTTETICYYMFYPTLLHIKHTFVGMPIVNVEVVLVVCN